MSSLYGTDGVDADKVPNTPAELEEAKSAAKSNPSNSSPRALNFCRPTSILINSAAVEKVEEEGFCDKSCADMAQDMMVLVRNVCEEKNKALDTKASLPRELPPFVIAIMVLKKFRFVVIMPDDSKDRENGFLAFYDGNTKSPSYGLYVTDSVRMGKIFSFFHGDLKQRDRDEIMSYIRAEAPTRRVDTTQDIAPFANGFFNYDTRKFEEYSPEQTHLFKFVTKWNPDAELPIIDQADGTQWRPDEWLGSLFKDDAELVLSMWQVIGAHLRPYNSFDQAAILMSPQGSNGKGTLLQLIESLVGSENTAHIPLDAMEQRFGMHRVIGKCAVIADENNVGAYHTSARNFKALVTSDTLTIDRKNRSVVDYRPFVQVTQCFNDNLRIADDSDSLFRRQLFVPFPKTFLGEKRKPEIREDYVKRPEVLEWVAKHVLLEIPFYKRFTPSTASEELKKEQKLVNSPVREFVDESYGNFHNDFIPLTCLYQMYKGWYSANVSERGRVASKKSFVDELRRVIDEHPEYGMEAPTNKRMQTSKFPKDGSGCRLDFSPGLEPILRHYMAYNSVLHDMFAGQSKVTYFKPTANGLLEGIWVNHAGPNSANATPTNPIQPEPWQPGDDPDPTYPVEP
ncbi:phage/plasmid primase, P4 family [uncultured Corynebacterium sp.]|uniref:DNA primase family protein n=1 Tax=uncultured Corynebacterium sp. TaxID=159447 RepID=UPI002630DE87|nr:phage/plasmid primase, P4 family [uncultured Corynebacterium sp.]